MFNNAKPIYERALKDSGHQTSLTYEPDQTVKSKSKNRNRKVIWFNPPFHKNLKTNIGKEFLHIIDRNFPPHHPLHKLFNRKTVKISYSCTTNIGSIMQAHNKKLISKCNQTNSRTCNCRNKDTCPVPGKCCTQCVVYKAEITTANETVSYIGSTGGEFKTRFNGHTQSFRSEAKKSSTTLSQYVWDKQLNPSPSIKWSFLKIAKPYTPGQRSCDVCLSEKLFIMKESKNRRNLNKRNEIVKLCPHRAKYRLDKIT